MDSLKICGIAILCAIAVSVVRQFRGEFSMPVRLSATVLLLTYATVLLAPSVIVLSQMFEGSAASGYAAILLKALAVAVMTQTAAELCRDCGEGSIAGNVEFIGRAEILVLCVPVIRDLIKIAEGIVNWN